VTVKSLLEQYGLVILFIGVAIESAGIPLPGETALITAAFLARPEYGTFSLAAVIVVGAAGAIVGDNVGYWLGRSGGRALLERWSVTKRQTARLLPPAERFFEKHGPKTIFFARFIAILRVTAAWVAGIAHMHWWRFLLWNAAGAICWATLVGLVSYYLGNAAASAIGKYGLYAAGGALAFAALGYLIVRRIERRVVGKE